MQDCEILLEIEKIEEPFYENDVGTLIRKLRGEEDTSKLAMQWLAEYMAFDFYETRSDDGSIWGTYFGPMWSGINDEGKAFESPSIKMVTPEILDYWANRTKQAKHPILKARYAALVWDFSREVTTKSAKIEMAHIWIDSVIRIAETNCHKYESQVIHKLEKVLSIAISINNTLKIENVKNAILAYELQISSEGKKGRWGFSFDHLLMNKQIILSDDEQASILNNLEKRLDITSNFSDKNSFDQFAAKDAATRLAQYYRKQNRPDDVKRVLLKYGNAFEHSSKEASGSLAISWLQGVESIYRDFGLKDEANQLLNTIRQRGPDSQKDLMSIPVEQNIPREDMDNYVNAIIEGNIDEAIIRIANDYIPKRDEVVRQIKGLAHNNPILFDMPATIQDHNGRTVGCIGSLEEDLDGHIVMQVTQNMLFSSIFLRHVIFGFLEKFSATPDSVVKELRKSPIFANEKVDIIIRGLEAYWTGDQLVAIHLLVPQIEGATRKLLELWGGTTYKHARNGGYQLKTFDEMLRDEHIHNVIGEDAAFYLRILYTDSRGWNLRNDVCHGISLPNQFCIQISDRVFHSLLLLSLIREQKK